MSEPVEHVPYIGYSEDAHGNEIESWGEPAMLEGFGFDPGSSSEPRRPGQDRVIVEPSLYGPYDMPFLPKDHVIVRGVTYDIEGEVRRWRGFFSSREFGAVVSLRRVNG